MTAPVVDLIELADPARGLRLLVPGALPDGTAVEIDRELDGPVHRLHARSADGSAVYVEIVSAEAFLDHMTVVAEQTEALSKRSDDVRVAPSASTEVGGRLATTFDVEGTLGGTWRTRRFVIVDGPAHTFRIVIDPTSDANRSALASLSFTSDPP